jgi:hypothetical protein
MYLSVVLVFGFLHHHHDDPTQLAYHDAEECAACQWQVSAVGDVPIVDCVLVPVHGVVVSTVSLFRSLLLSAPFLASTASRAPPATLA